MPEIDPAVPETHVQIAAYIRRPEFASRLEMLELALKTGSCSFELACRILNLPKHAVGSVIAEILIERMPEVIIQVEVEAGFLLLMTQTPEQIGQMTAAILCAHPNARASVLQPVKTEDIH